MPTVCSMLFLGDQLLGLILLPGSFFPGGVLFIANLPTIIQYRVLHRIEADLILKPFT